MNAVRAGRRLSRWALVLCGVHLVGCQTSLRPPKVVLTEQDRVAVVVGKGSRAATAAIAAEVAKALRRRTGGSVTHFAIESAAPAANSRLDEEQSLPRVLPDSRRASAADMLAIVRVVRHEVTSRNWVERPRVAPKAGLMVGEEDPYGQDTPALRIRRAAIVKLEIRFVNARTGQTLADYSAKGEAVSVRTSRTPSSAALLSKAAQRAIARATRGVVRVSTQRVGT